MIAAWRHDGQLRERPVPAQRFYDDLKRFYDRTLQRFKDIAVVAAAGNDGQREQFWPAASPWTVAIGALASDGRSRAGFSN
jgi:hypothetical protein